MMEQIVLTLVSGVVVPILLETWKARREGAKQSPATEPAAPATTSAGIPDSALAPRPIPAAGPSLVKIILRLVLAAVFGTIIALIVSVLIGPDTSEFTTQDGVLSVLFVLVLWYVLGKFGPLSDRR